MRVEFDGGASLVTKKIGGAVLCALVMAGCQQPSFSDEDIANLKSEITANA